MKTSSHGQVRSSLLEADALLRAVATVHNKSPERPVRMGHIVQLLLFLVMNMYLVHNLSKCESAATSAHEKDCKATFLFSY